MKKKNPNRERIEPFWAMTFVVGLILFGVTFCSNNNDDLILDEDIPSTEEYYREQGYTTENFDGFLIVRKIQGE